MNPRPMLMLARLTMVASHIVAATLPVALAAEAITAPAASPSRFANPIHEFADVASGADLVQTSLNDLVFDEEVSKYKSPESPVLGVGLAGPGGRNTRWRIGNVGGGG